MEAWEKPILAHTEEVSGQFSRPGERAILHYVSEADKQRILSGMACFNCLAVFPAPPSLVNLQAWKPILHRWAPVKKPIDVQVDLAMGRCPTCNSDIRPEMSALMDVGPDYNNERPEGEAA